MMQIQGVMAMLAVETPGQSGESLTTNSDSPMSFEQLLAQLGGSMGVESQSCDVTRVSRKQEALVREEESHRASLGWGALAALLAQSMGEVPISTPIKLAEPTNRTRAENMAHLLTPNLETRPGTGIEIPAEICVRALNREFQQLPVAGLTAHVPLALDEAMENTGDIAPALERLVKLLQELQVDVSMAQESIAPKRWGQLERFWALRGTEETTGVEKQVATSAPSGESSTGQIRPMPSLRTLATHSSPQVELPLVVEAEAASKAETQQMFGQLVFHLELAAAGEQDTELAAAQVTYRAQEGMSLQQQLEQGLAVGVRQLRFLRSEEGLTVRMQLYPENLGEVRVELKLEGDVLTAQLRTFEPQAAKALLQELPLLRENLINHGFTQVYLGAETAQQFDHSSGQRRQRFQEEQQRRLQRVSIIKTEDPEEPTVMRPSSRLDYRL